MLSAQPNAKLLPKILFILDEWTRRRRFLHGIDLNGEEVLHLTSLRRFICFPLFWCSNEKSEHQLLDSNDRQLAMAKSLVANLIFIWHDDSSMPANSKHSHISIILSILRYSNTKISDIWNEMKCRICRKPINKLEYGHKYRQKNYSLIWIAIFSAYARTFNRIEGKQTDQTRHTQKERERDRKP